MELLQNLTCGTLADVEFLSNANKTVIECRRALKWSYVIAFYLKDGSRQKHMFEIDQGQLEKFSDELHGLIEVPLEKLIPERVGVAPGTIGASAGANMLSNSKVAPKPAPKAAAASPSSANKSAPSAASPSSASVASSSASPADLQGDELKRLIIKKTATANKSGHTETHGGACYRQPSLSVWRTSLDRTLPLLLAAHISPCLLCVLCATGTSRDWSKRRKEDSTWICSCTDCRPHRHTQMRNNDRKHAKTTRASIDSPSSLCATFASVSRPRSSTIKLWIQGLLGLEQGFQGFRVTLSFRLLLAPASLPVRGLPPSVTDFDPCCVDAGTSSLPGSAGGRAQSISIASRTAHLCTCGGDTLYSYHCNDCYPPFEFDNSPCRASVSLSRKDSNSRTFACSLARSLEPLAASKP